MAASSRAGALLSCLLGLVAAAAAAYVPIQNLWMPPFRGQDWSRAGYRENARPIPNPPVRYNVKTQFGAKGDGKTDDSHALLRAVAAANANPNGGVVYFPAGSYVLRWPLTITRSRVVLRGAGTGKSMIYMTRSLSDVFQGTWVVKPNGRITTAWNSAGGFITFKGDRQRSTNWRTFLAKVPSRVGRGATTLPVNTTAGFRVGMTIRVFVNDHSTTNNKAVLERRRLLAAGPGGAGGAGVPKLLTKQAPGWVKSHPVFKLAMEGLAKDDEDGVTAAQAAAADEAYAAQWAAANGGGEGSVGTAAVQGSVAAWLYGNNMADSGPSSGVINADEVGFTAVVTGVDRARKLLRLDRACPFAIIPAEGWEARVHVDQPTMTDVGIEHMTLRFRHFRTQQHHTDKGFNALQLYGISYGWVRNLRIVNADSGIFTSWVDRSTFTDVTVSVSKSRVDPRWPTALNGHHALSLGEGHSNVLTRFNVAVPYIHDVSLASSCSLNVVTQGRGHNLNLDHHRTAPWANLITDLNMGIGDRAFASGGNEARGAHSGMLNTYYNLRRNNGRPIPLPDCTFGATLNFVGAFTGNKCPNMNWRVLPLARDSPPNLFVAQLREFARRVAARRRNGAAA